MESKGVLLFVDATVGPPEQSRTALLCRSYLESFQKKHPNFEIRHLILREETILPNRYDDIKYREWALEQGCHHADLEYAKEFAAADKILIGAPYWDLSFPALLKVYLEKVCVAGVTFSYTQTGVNPLCRATSMTYLTTCGGKRYRDFGEEYLLGLCQEFFGIPKFASVAAELLDVEGMDVRRIMEEACSRGEKLASGEEG